MRGTSSGAVRAGMAVSRWLAALVLLVAGFAPRTARAAHPQVLFDAAGLAQLRARVSDSAYAEIVAAMRATIAARHGSPVLETEFGDVVLAVNAIEGLALAAAVLGDQASLDLAHASLLNLTEIDGTLPDIAHGHVLNALAVGYDVLFDQLTPAERDLVKGRVTAVVLRDMSEVAAGDWWVNNLTNNHNFINFAAIGVAGMALDGEDSRAPTWFATARDDYVKLQTVLNAASDGSWHEGVGYHQYALVSGLNFLLGAARRGLVLDDNQNLRSYGAYRLYTQLPDLTRGYIATHGDWAGWSGPGSMSLLRYVARRFDDPLAQEAARVWLAGTGRSTATYNLFYQAFEFIGYDPSVPTANTSVLPKDFTAADQGLAVMRSGFTPGSFVLALKSGVLLNHGNFDRWLAGGFPGEIFNISHDHMDDFGLWFYGDAEWLLPECVGYNIGRTADPPAWQTVFHNSMLIDGTGQIGDARGAIDNPSFLPGAAQRIGTLPIHRSTDHYSIARADGLHLYPDGDGLSELTRTTSFSRDGYVVLRDTVAMSATHRVEQLFHFMQSASQDGSWVRGNSHNDRVLGIRVVSPASFAVSIGTQTAAKLSKEFEPDGVVSLVKVRPATDAARTNFLELLFPTRGATWSARPAVTALDANSPDHGLVLPLASGEERWIFSSATAGGLVLAGDTAAVRTTSGGAISRVVLLGVGSVSDQSGARLLLSSVSDGLLEVEYAGTVARVSGTGAVGARLFGTGITSVLLNGVTPAAHRDGSLIVIDAVTAPVPTVISVSPSSALVGASLTATVIGTGFGLGTSCSFGAGITVTCTVVSTTQLSAALTIAASAAPGPRTVSVTTPGGTGSLADAFTVVPPVPAVTGVAPTSGRAGTSLTATVTGTGFVSGATCSFGAGITASCTFVSATQLSAALTIAGSAAPGARTVSVTTAGGTGSLADAFTVVLPVPTVTGVSPTSGAVGTSLTVAVTGTGFVSGATCSFGAGITATCTFVSATQLSAALTIAASAAPGARTVSVTTAGGTGSLADAFTVVLPVPTVTGVSPTSGAVGTSLTVAVTGTGFVSGATCSFGAGITASCTFVSATRLSAALTIAASAAPGARTVSVTTPGGTGSLADAFTVVSPVPAVTGVSPTIGRAGTSLTAAVTGTGFVSGATCSFGAGITASCTFVSATQLSAALTIAASAAPGARTVSVTTPGGTGSLANAFTVVTTPVVLFTDRFTAVFAPGLGSSWSTVGTWYRKADKARGETALGTARALVTTPADQTAQVRVLLTVGADGSGPIVRFSGTTFYALRLRRAGRVEIVRFSGGTATVLGSASATINAETFYTARLTASGTSPVVLTGALAGVSLLSVQDTSSARLTSGQAGMLSGTLARSMFDDFVLTTP